jgi:hypothetical protein
MASPLISKRGYFNSVDDTIKIAVIGCGGRGTGAAMQALLSNKMSSLLPWLTRFGDRLDDCYKELTNENNEEGNVKAKVAVPEQTSLWVLMLILKLFPWLTLLY